MNEKEEELCDADHDPRALVYDLMLGRERAARGKEDEKGAVLLTRWDKEVFGQWTASPGETPGGFQLVMLSSGTMVVGKGEGRAGLSSAASPRTGARRGDGFRPGLDTLAERGQA